MGGRGDRADAREAAARLVRGHAHGAHRRDGSDREGGLVFPAFRGGPVLRRITVRATRPGCWSRSSRLRAPTRGEEPSSMRIVSGAGQEFFGGPVPVPGWAPDRVGADTR